MFDSYILPGPVSMMTRPVRHTDEPVTVFLCRRHFEAGVGRILAKDARRCAVLHMTLRGGDTGTGSISRRTLNLAANALRAGVRSGALVYLGDAEFAVLLQDTDAREAVAYARAVTAIVSGFKVMWEDELLPLQACMGGVTSEGCTDAAALLERAMEASELAKGKPGCKVHLMQQPVEVPHLPLGRPAAAGLRAF